MSVESTHSDELPAVSPARLAAAVVVGEVTPIVALVGVVAFFGPTSPDEADAFARRAGAWVGPLVGAATILVLAAWAGRRSRHPRAQGLLLGTILAALDLALLTAMGESLQGVVLASNLGKVVAGGIGGSFAAWRAVRAAKVSLLGIVAILPTPECGVLGPDDDRVMGSVSRDVAVARETLGWAAASCYISGAADMRGPHHRPDL